MKIWANSGDAHVREPADLWTERLPLELAARMPRAERIDERTERVHVDGYSFERHLPVDAVMTDEDLEASGLKARGREAGMGFRDFVSRPPGSWDLQTRHKDLDQEGIWAEVVYPSFGLWNGLIKDPHLYREGVRVFNDWLKETFLDVTTRSVPTGEISIRSVADAVTEAERLAGMGFKVVSVPVALDSDLPTWNDPAWEPLWSTLEQSGMVLASHAGTLPQRSEGGSGVTYHGAGSALLNYFEVSFSAQRFAAVIAASGVLDRHPRLRVLISEGGATWIPFVVDRMTEAYRQHAKLVRPKLSRTLAEIVFEQIYTTFQHDVSAVGACHAVGYRNVMWGSDYPHMEGTYGHTQATLHELFAGVDDQIRYRVTRGAFLDLFPDVGEPPADLDPAEEVP